MEKHSNISKFKKARNPNIGFVIFFFILICILASVIYNGMKIKISIYEVVEENLSRDMTVTGVIVRDETVYYTSESGYINYYIPEGQRAKKNATIYSVDENRSLYDMLGIQENFVLSERNMADMKRLIASYGSQFDGCNFDTVYSLKAELSSMVNVIADENLLGKIENYVSENGLENNFHFSFVMAPTTGLVCYTSDSLDGLTAERVNASVFSDESFSSVSLRKTGSYAAGEPVYKLITDNNWQILCPLTLEQYTLLKDRTRLRFQIQQDDFEFTAPVSFEMRGSDYYMILSLNKYGANYINERFLTLDIVMQEKKGLKIPKSAVVTKEFYLVPPQFFTIGGDSNERGLILLTYDAKTGEPDYVFEQTRIYYEDEEYAYVSKDSFPIGTMVYSPDLSETLALNNLSRLEGVYNVNRGFAVFRRIERLDENEDYLIVCKGTSNGISRYDHIALEVDDIQEDSIIYK